MIGSKIKRWGRIALPVALLPAMLLTACSKDPAGDQQVPGGYDWETHVPFVSQHEAAFTPENTDYHADPIERGALRLDESSGLAASITNPGMVWTHQDAGNSNLIYLLDGQTAEILCTYRVTGASNIDWEDMEVITDPETGKSYIYLSDTGDNEERRGSSVIYRLEEPVYDQADEGKTLSTETSVLERYVFRYQGGSRDVESLFVDRDTKDIYLVTKRGERSLLYIVPFPQLTEGTNTAYLVGTFGFREASAATANSRGDKFIIRNRQYLFYWERNPGEKVWETLQRIPERLPFVGEVQGEAVCFDADDNYYTSSERGGLPAYPPVYQYLKK